MATSLELEVPSSPRAPTQAAWDAMSPEARAAVAEALPAWIPMEECGAPEGDPHFEAKLEARDALRRFFGRSSRRVYVTAELAVYYPNEARFSPDVMAVTDVDPKARDRWVVSAEGKGLEWVLEVLVRGDRRKDLRRNVTRYAALGIPEYFVYDRARGLLYGYRLPASGERSYEPIRPKEGFLPSLVLGLEVAILGGRLRFRQGNAELLWADEIIDRLESLAEERSTAAEQEAQRAEAEAQRADAEAQRAESAVQRADAEAQRADAAEQARRESEAKLEAVLRELEALKKTLPKDPV